MEAQRYPDDFDGISAGDPAALLTIQNSFGGNWQKQANARPDGSLILLAAKARLVHEAVLAQCDNLTGLKGGPLADPRACRFEPASLQCPAGAQDAAKCLTAEEVGALQRISSGATGERGQSFTFGLQRGAELQLHLPESNQDVKPGMTAAFSSARTVGLMFRPIGQPIDSDRPFEYSDANYERMAEFAPYTTRPIPICDPSRRATTSCCCGMAGPIRSSRRGSPSPITRVCSHSSAKPLRRASCGCSCCRVSLIAWVAMATTGSTG